MASIKEILQTADWKSEKHVPVIDSPDAVKKGEEIEITVSVGKEIAHPNTTEHYISWIELYFLAEGAKLAVELGRFEFAAHGASAQGPNTSMIFTKPSVTIKIKTEKSGTLFASSYCNIHGLWESAKGIMVK
ncbi:MAG: class II SORL domain-containing protein [Candidatus Omnitrophota bacterium]